MWRLPCTQCCHETLALPKPIFTKCIGIFQRKDKILQAGCIKSLPPNSCSSGGYSQDHGDHTIWAFQIRTHAFWAARRITDVPAILNDILTGLNFAFAYLDDFLITDEHKTHMIQLFEWLNYLGVIVNSEMYVFRVSWSQFLRYLVNAQFTFRYWRKFNK